MAALRSFAALRMTGFGGGENFKFETFRFQMRLEAHDEESVVPATQKEQVQKHSSFRGNFIAWRRSEEKPLFLLDH